MVDSQVLTQLNDASIYGTSADQTSIMCYQLPASITKDGRPILGGRDINSTDAAFAGRIYPRSGRARSSAANDLTEDDWDETEDVDVPQEQLARW